MPVRCAKCTAGWTTSNSNPLTRDALLNRRVWHVERDHTGTHCVMTWSSCGGLNGMPPRGRVYASTHRAGRSLVLVYMDVRDSYDLDRSQWFLAKKNAELLVRLVEFKSEGHVSLSPSSRVSRLPG